MQNQKIKEEYLEALCEVARKEGRLPKKSDFSEADVNRIKGMFGPWPWALESAGLKESKQEERRAKNAARRLRAKQKRENEKSSVQCVCERKEDYFEKENH